MVKKSKWAFEVDLKLSKILYIHVTVRRYRFIFNNQPDALFIQIYSVIKLLHVSGNFFAHHQESPTVRRALVSFMLQFAA